MVSFRDKMMAATSNISNAKDIPVVLPPPGTEQPVTPVGTMAQLSHTRQELGRANDKIVALETRLAAAGAGAVLPVDKLRRNPWQPRINFNPVKMTELADSIREIGQLQPVLVRCIFDAGGEVDYYELIAGERRWRAHQMNGMSELKAVITEATDEEMAIFALAENISRDDLVDYEISNSVLLAEKAFKKRSHLAEALGISRGSMYRYLAFGSLPEFIRVDLDETPTLLGGNAADDIAKVLKKYSASSQAESEKAEQLMRELWVQLKSGSLDQTKFATVLEGAMQRPDTGAAPAAARAREIRKVFAGKAQAGSITKDSANFTVKLKSTLLTPAKEERIRNLIDELFKDDGA